MNGKADSVEPALVWLLLLPEECIIALFPAVTEVAALRCRCSASSVHGIELL